MQVKPRDSELPLVEVLQDGCDRRSLVGRGAVGAEAGAGLGVADVMQHALSLDGQNNRNIINEKNILNIRQKFIRYHLLIVMMIMIMTVSCYIIFNWVSMHE